MHGGHAYKGAPLRIHVLVLTPSDRKGRGSCSIKESFDSLVEARVERYAVALSLCTMPGVTIATSSV